MREREREREWDLKNKEGREERKSRFEETKREKTRFEG